MNKANKRYYSYAETPWPVHYIFYASSAAKNSRLLTSPAFKNLRSHPNGHTQPNGANRGAALHSRGWWKRPLHLPARSRLRLPHAPPGPRVDRQPHRRATAAPASLGSRCPPTRLGSGVAFTSPESDPPPLSKPEAPPPRWARQQLLQNFFFFFEITGLGSTGSVFPSPEGHRIGGAAVQTLFLSGVPGRPPRRSLCRRRRDQASSESSERSPAPRPPCPPGRPWRPTPLPSTIAPPMLLSWRERKAPERHPLGTCPGLGREEKAPRVTSRHPALNTARSRKGCFLSPLPTLPTARLEGQGAGSR
ncbi:uncharacterized protein LOC118664833 [Myotis myotis]|uniref:uncharacterized protein LOC118664833 n=1 Tax=Myotis myotis TaxID=51298 RepID=UPI00174B4EFA|nr:uncharacterized protein LOC118664833 [Myotis myotis]